ncbi:MAG: thiamine phosphate synthase [Myxococcota bacterium]
MTSPLPRFYLISPGLHGQGHELVRAAEVAFEAGARMLQVREPQLLDGPLTELVRALLEVAARYDARLVLNAGKGAGLRVARKLKLPVHLDASWPVSGVRRELQGMLVGASAHTPMEVAQAAAARADFLQLSPLLEARPGAQVPPMGLETLSALSRKVPLPLYVMGGVGPEQVPTVLQAGAYGVAARTTVFFETRVTGNGSEEAGALVDLEQLSKRVNAYVEALSS